MTSWTIGDEVDVISKEFVYCPAKILKVTPSNNKIDYRIHYIGWDDCYDETVSDPQRIFPPYTFTKRVKIWVKFSAKLPHWPCIGFVRQPVADNPAGELELRLEEKMYLRPCGQGARALLPYQHGVWISTRQVSPFHVKGEERRAEGLLYRGEGFAQAFREAVRDCEARREAEDVALSFQGSLELNSFGQLKEAIRTKEKDAEIVEQKHSKQDNSNNRINNKINNDKINSKTNKRDGARDSKTSHDNNHNNESSRRSRLSSAANNVPGRKSSSKMSKVKDDTKVGEIEGLCSLRVHNHPSPSFTLALETYFLHLERVEEGEKDGEKESVVKIGGVTSFLSPFNKEESASKKNPGLDSILPSFKTNSGGKRRASRARRNFSSQREGILLVPQKVQAAPTRSSKRSLVRGSDQAVIVSKRAKTLRSNAGYV